jgi:hypothetical protein
MRAGISVVVALGLTVGAVAGDAAAQTPPGTPPAQQSAPAAPPSTQPPLPAPAAPTAPAEPSEPGTPPPPPPPSYPAPEPAPAPAQEPAPPPTYQPLGRPEPEIEEDDWDPWEHATPDKHRHDGFYLRLNIGMTVFGSIAGDDHTLADIDEITVSSVGLAISIGIGGALTDNLILNADLYQAMMFDPGVEIDGEDVGDADELGFDVGVGDDAEIGGVGIGVTYYIMPINIYLGGSIGIGQAVFEDGRGDREGSEIGLALNALVGKEWWVGTDWGLGLAGQFTYLRAEDDIFGDINALAVNLLFSATYN